MLLDHAQHFEQLTSLLATNAPYWRCQPFKATPAWASAESPLTQAVYSLTDDTVHAAQASDNALLNALQSCLPEQCDNVRRLCELPNFQPAEAIQAPAHIPGRKWQQITHFGAALQHCDGPLLEWCAGKAHLGRWLNRHYNCSVTALECQTALVALGNELARAASRTEHHQQQPALHVQHCDVLTGNPGRYLSKVNHAVALHACGGLHRKLLTDATTQRIERLSYSPCCYHKYLDDTYEPMSRAGLETDLRLSLTEVRGAVRQSTTAGNAERARHRKLQSWRLGFDALQREVRGMNEYLPTPPVSSTVLQGSFRDFCEWMAKHKQISTGGKIDFDAFEATGQTRYGQVARQELLRELFRRPLELWLVLDEVLFLEENGYRCDLGTFCEPDITPRNLFINATAGLPDRLL